MSLTDQILARRCKAAPLFVTHFAPVLTAGLSSAGWARGRFLFQPTATRTNCGSAMSRTNQLKEITSRKSGVPHLSFTHGLQLPVGSRYRPYNCAHVSEREADPGRGVHWPKGKSSSDNITPTPNWVPSPATADFASSVSFQKGHKRLPAFVGMLGSSLATRILVILQWLFGFAGSTMKVIKGTKSPTHFCVDTEKSTWCNVVSNPEAHQIVRTSSPVINKSPARWC